MFTGRAVRVASTLKRVDRDKQIEETVPRDGLWAAQTPQVFRRELLLEAFAKRGECLQGQVEAFVGDQAAEAEQGDGIAGQRVWRQSGPIDEIGNNNGSRLQGTVLC